MAFSGGFGPPILDFSPLSGLADTFSRARKQARDEQFEEEAPALIEAYINSVGGKTLDAPSGGTSLSKFGQGGQSFATSTGTPRSNIERGTVHVAETEDDVQRLERATGMTVDQDLDRVVRTVYGEAGGEGIMGQRAVASVIANRARQSGMTPSDVVLAKGQFEPWSDPEARARMESLDRNSPEYVQLAALVEPALRGQAADPTGGATHFYAPKAQAALGRDAPSWDDGTGKDIGNHRFFAHGYGPQGKVQVAQADAPAPGAKEAQFQIPGQAGMPAAQGGAQPVNRTMLRALYANPNTRPLVGEIIKNSMNPQSQFDFQVVGDQLYRVSKRTGQVEPVQGVTKPNVDIKEVNGRLIAVNKADLSASDITPQNLPSGYRPMTAQERQAYGVPGDTGGFIGPDGKPAALPGTTRIQNTTNLPGQKGEVKYDETVSENYAKTFIDLQKSGRAAIGTKNTLALMERLTKDPNFYSGFGAERQLMLNKALASFGITDAKVNAPNEVFTSLVNDVVLGKLGGSLGPGVSNSDVGFLQSTAPNLTNTKEGNRLLIAITGKMVDRQQQIAQMARDYAKNNGGRIDAAFDDLLDQYAQQNPLFTDEDYKAAQAAMSGEPIPTLQPGPRTSLPIKIPDKISPDEVRKKFPSGTKIVLPDGTEGVVP